MSQKISGERPDHLCSSCAFEILLLWVKVLKQGRQSAAPYHPSLLPRACSPLNFCRYCLLRAQLSSFPTQSTPVSIPSPSAFQIHSLRQQGSTKNVFNRPTIFILTFSIPSFPLDLNHTQPAILLLGLLFLLTSCSLHLLLNLAFQACHTMMEFILISC